MKIYRILFGPDKIHSVYRSAGSSYEFLDHIELDMSLPKEDLVKQAMQIGVDHVENKVKGGLSGLFDLGLR